MSTKDTTFESQLMRAAKGEEFQRINNCWIRKGESWAPPAEYCSYKNCDGQRVPYFYNWPDAPNGASSQSYLQFMRYITKGEISEDFPGQWTSDYRRVRNRKGGVHDQQIEELWANRSLAGKLSGDKRWSYMSDFFFHFPESPSVHFPVAYQCLEVNAGTKAKRTVPRNVLAIVRRIGLCHRAEVPAHMIPDYRCPEIEE